MNRLTVPYEEIENRLAICCEFLIDRKKPIEEAYESLMGKLGRKIMEYTEFEYWFKRFQNNQFDLGYDASQDTVSRIQNTIDPGAIVQKDQAEVGKRKQRHRKIKFKEDVLPPFSRILINELTVNLKKIDVYFTHQVCIMKFDENLIRFDKMGEIWIISYQHTDRTCKIVDPEKSIIDHLWLALKNPNMKLGSLKIELNRDYSEFSNFKKLETLLQSMLDTFDHQIETSIINYKGFNEDTFFSLLKHIKPETLSKIDFDISWKEKGNYQKLMEIVETDQWKQAKTIYSRGVAPLKIEDFLHCEVSLMTYDRITPEDVLRVTEHLFNSIGTKCCTLYSGKKKLDICEDIDAILDVLLSQNNQTDISSVERIHPQNKYRFKILSSGKCVFLSGNENYIVVQNF